MLEVDLKDRSGYHVKLVVELGTKHQDNEFLIDTGFTMDDFGLVLPLEALPDELVSGAAKLRLANGMTVPVETIPDGKVVRIGKEWLEQAIETPIAFLDGLISPVLGLKLLRLCRLELSGPDRIGRLVY
jgi:hypothetical protein